MIEDIWYVKGINIFEEITDREARLLKRRSKLKEYKRYDLVCDNSSDPSYIYVIKKGSVRIYKPESEKDNKVQERSQGKPNVPLQQKGISQKRTSLLTDENELFSQFTNDTSQSNADEELEQLPVTLKLGEFFGIMYNSEQIGDFVAESMDNSEIYLTRRSTLKLLFKYTSEHSMTIKKTAGLRKYKLQNRIQNLIEQDVVSRLASLLLKFSEKYSTWKSSKAVLNFKLSTEKLSKLVGATKEDVNQVLELLKREKIISIKRKRISVLNGWELKKTARSGRLSIQKNSGKGY